MLRLSKTIKYKSAYKYVAKIMTSNNKIKFSAYVAHLKKYAVRETEREAAIEVDKFFIMAGKEPRNILKQKI